MARKSVTDATNKWAQRVSQSGDYYRQGVQNTTKDWAQRSVASADRRNAGLIQAINNGSIDRGIQAAGTQKWRTRTLGVGVSNWQTNTPKAAPAYQAGMQRSYNYMNAADQAIDGMPSTTKRERIARASAWLQAMADQADADKATR